jgi:hypothetical protein
MCSPSLNVIFGIWRVRYGVAHVALVPRLPKNPLYGRTIQNVAPGGGVQLVKDRGDPIRGGRRETYEELGLIMKLRFQPKLLTRKSDAKGHVKEGYIVPYSAFRGRMRTKIIEDNDSILYPPIEVPIDEAIRIVFHTKNNKFHLNFLLDLKDDLDKRGIPTTGPALHE